MIDQLKSATCKTVKQFQDRPLDFLSESDIQALLFVELRNAMSEVQYPYTAEPANHRFGCDEPFSIRPITTEYYLYKNGQARFDVAVLSETPDSNLEIWRQPCRVGIEIKLWQPGYRDSSYLRDVEKLKNYQKYLQNFTEERSFTGIAMLFVHPWVKNEKNGKKRLAAILDEPWKAILNEHSVDAYPENGVALHLVTQESHWWKQFSGPSTAE
jgi:hypothetical protein